jgi:hypothetical protein
MGGFQAELDAPAKAAFDGVAFRTIARMLPARPSRGRGAHLVPATPLQRYSQELRSTCLDVPQAVSSRYILIAVFDEGGIPQERGHAAGAPAPGEGVHFVPPSPLQRYSRELRPAR